MNEWDAKLLAIANRAEREAQDENRRRGNPQRVRNQRHAGLADAGRLAFHRPSVFRRGGLRPFPLKKPPP